MRLTNGKTGKISYDSKFACAERLKGIGIVYERFHSRYEVYKVHLPRSSLKIVGNFSSVNL